MEETSEVVVTGIGMISPVGSNAAQSCAAVRGGIGGLCEWPEVYEGEQDEDSWEPPEPVVGGRAPVDGAGPERLQQLLGVAVQDLIEGASLGREVFESAGLWLALPSPLPGAPGADPRMFSRAFYARTGLTDGGSHTVLTAGSAGALLAISLACAALRAGERTLCIVAGVDTYVDPTRLAALDGAGRLRTARNSDAFAPGEAACALSLELRSHAEARGATPLARVERVGTGMEEGSIVTELPCRGDGLSSAIRAALGGEGVDWVVCDLNGESYRAMEWGMCRVRLSEALSGVKHLWHPADCLGDVGAATGAVLVGLAARAFARGYAPARRCLVWTSADEGQRAALALGSPL